MRATVIVLLVILLFAYPHIKYKEYVSRHKIVALADCQFRTGDIIMSKYDEPCIFRARNGLNIKPTILKNITDSIQYYSQGHYTHCGMIIMLDSIPHLYHLTDDICFDQLTKSYKISVPTLVSMHDMLGYHGHLYHYRLNPKYTARQLTKIPIFGKQIRANPFHTILINGLKISPPDDDIVCTDFLSKILTLYGLPAPNEPASLADILHLLDTCYSAPVIIQNAWSLHLQQT